jgi:hypothetical protein
MRRTARRWQTCWRRCRSASLIAQRRIQLPNRPAGGNLSGDTRSRRKTFWRTSSAALTSPRMRYAHRNSDTCHSRTTAVKMARSPRRRASSVDSSVNSDCSGNFESRPVSFRLEYLRSSFIYWLPIIKDAHLAYLDEKNQRLKNNTLASTRGNGSKSSAAMAPGIACATHAPDRKRLAARPQHLGKLAC